MLLGGIGLGGLGSAMFIPGLASFQSYMVGAALVSLVIGGALLWRRRCACDASGGRMSTTLTVIGLTLGAAFLALGLAVG